MQKIILCILTVASFLFKIQAQSALPNLQVGNYMFYKGAYLQVDTSVNDSSFESTFFPTFESARGISSNSDVLYACTYDQRGGTDWWRHSHKDSLTNKVYKVEKVTDYDEVPLLQNGDAESWQRPYFQLTDTASKATVFFSYYLDRGIAFPFKVSGLKMNAKSICSGLYRRVDEFTDVVSIVTPGSNSPVSLIKTIDPKKGTSYALNLNTKAETSISAEGDIIILFTDGTKWSRKAKLKTDQNKDQYQVKTFIILTPEDLTVFASKKIKKFRLDIYDSEVDTDFASLFTSYVSCIRTAK